LRNPSFRGKQVPLGVVRGSIGFDIGVGRRGYRAHCGANPAVRKEVFGDRLRHPRLGREFGESYRHPVFGTTGDNDLIDWRQVLLPQ
jgi:hypothetical protein